MIEGAGSGNSLARAAIEAALKSQSDLAAKVREQVAQTLPPENLAAMEATGGAQASPSFESSLAEGLKAVNASVAAVDELPLDMMTGKISDFHELAGRLKQAELTFKFSLEVRNKLIDAYREVMRMSV